MKNICMRFDIIVVVRLHPSGAFISYLKDGNFICEIIIDPTTTTSSTNATITSANYASLEYHLIYLTNPLHR